MADAFYITYILTYLWLVSYLISLWKRYANSNMVKCACLVGIS